MNNSYEIQAAPSDVDGLVRRAVCTRPDLRVPSPGRDASIGSMALAGKVLTIDQKSGLLRIAA